MLSEVNVSTHLRQQKNVKYCCCKISFHVSWILATICTMDPQALKLPISIFVASFLQYRSFYLLRLP